MRSWTLIGLAGLAFTGAPVVSGAVTIADILAAPDTYDGKTVTVTGTIEVALPVGAESSYNLRDGASRVTVVSRVAPPSVGDHLAVTATVHAFAGGDTAEDKPFPPFLVEGARVPAP